MKLRDWAKIGFQLLVNAASAFGVLYFVTSVAGENASEETLQMGVYALVFPLATPLVLHLIYVAALPAQMKWERTQSADYVQYAASHWAEPKRIRPSEAAKAFISRMAVVAALAALLPATLIAVGFFLAASPEKPFLNNCSSRSIDANVKAYNEHVQELNEIRAAASHTKDDVAYNDLLEKLYARQEAFRSHPLAIGYDDFKPAVAEKVHEDCVAANRKYWRGNIKAFGIGTALFIAVPAATLLYMIVSATLFTTVSNLAIGLMSFIRKRWLRFTRKKLPYDPS